MFCSADARFPSPLSDIGSLDSSVDGVPSRSRLATASVDGACVGVPNPSRTTGLLSGIFCSATSGVASCGGASCGGDVDVSCGVEIEGKGSTLASELEEVLVFVLAIGVEVAVAGASIFNPA